MCVFTAWGMPAWPSESLHTEGLGIRVSVCSLQILIKLLFCESLKLVLPPGGAGRKLQGWELSLGPYQGRCQWGVREGASREVGGGLGELSESVKNCPAFHGSVIER